MTMPTMQQALKLYEETMRKRCAESSRFELGRSKGERIHAAMVAVAALCALRILWEFLYTNLKAIEVLG